MKFDIEKMFEETKRTARNYSEQKTGSLMQEVGWVLFHHSYYHIAGYFRGLLQTLIFIQMTTPLQPHPYSTFNTEVNHDPSFQGTKFSRFEVNLRKP